MAMVQYIARLNETTLTQRLRLLGMTLVVAHLYDYATKAKLSHIHAHSCANSAHLCALVNLSGVVTYSLTLHGDLPVYGTDHRHKFKNAAFVSVVTYALQAQVMDVCGLAKDRLPVIRMGVDPQKFRVVQQGTQVGILRLVTVARLAECKGHTYALQAIKKLKDIAPHLKLHYTIVGEGELMADLKRQVQELGLDQNVELTGTAGEDQVIGHLNQSDVFVLPSVGAGEAAPVSVMEAMACGLVVISSIIGGTPEMIDPGRDGYLFAQMDVDALARIIADLAHDPSLRQKIGAAARIKAETSFSSQGFARELYQRIKQPNFLDHAS
jgi:glycosyltransferase involved in cell wall biosynthesis